MRYMGSIYVSDVMDQIAATIEVQGWEAQYGPPETVYQRTLITPGYGDYEPLAWLRRALDVIASDMSEPTGESKTGGPLSGGTHTISETGDRRL